MSCLKLIVGLGNPGDEYADTRHNAGIWLVTRIAQATGARFRDEKKFYGRMATVQIDGVELKILVPTTYMNESGKCVGAVAQFYKIAPEEILVVHDELDLPIGVVRLKSGGGLAGHNGLRDIAAALGGSQDFKRIRIGVGHPGDKSRVTGHVLGKASEIDRDLIGQCIDEALRHLPQVVRGEMDKAMNSLNSFRVEQED